MIRAGKKIFIGIFAAIIFLSSLFLGIAPKINKDFPSADTVLQFFGISAKADNTEKLIFLDVGQGDGALILSGGHAALIDCGTAEDDGISLVKELHRYGVTSIEYLFLSHPHSDHIGGSLAVMNSFAVKKIYCPEFLPANSGDSGIFQRMIALAQTKRISLSGYQTGEIVTVGAFSVSTVWCDETAVSENNRSAVLKVFSDDFSALFTGDIEAETEKTMLSSSPDLKCDILKIGHHGSKSSTTAAFLGAISPKYAIISSGENTFGHPSGEVLSRLKSAGVNTFRTDVNGNIIFYFADDIQVECTY